MSKKILALLLILIFSPGNIFAQNVAPTITDPAALAKVQEEREAVLEENVR